MDTGTIIIVVIFLLIVMVPIVMMIWKNIRKEKLKLNNLKALADSCQCKISFHQLWSTAAIGMDADAKCLFYYSENESRENHCIRLNEVQKCIQVCTNGTLHQTADSKMLDKMELVFSFIDKTRADVVIEFYNVKIDGYVQHGELQILHTWHNHVQRILNNAA